MNQTRPMYADRSPFPRQNNFDLIRLLAALQVVLVHFRDHLKMPVPDDIGYFPGVPVFFIVSGFLISASLANSSSLLDYFVRRALRIYPALWTMTFITILLFLALGLSTELWRWLIYIPAHLTFFQHINAGALRGFGTGGNGVLWTIVVELQFYLLLPLLFIATRQLGLRGRTIVFAAIVILSVALYVWFIPHWSTRSDLPMLQRYLLSLGYISAPPHISGFLIGAIAYLNFERLRPLVEGKALYWLVGYLAFMLTVDKGFGLAGWAFQANFIVVLVQRVLLAGVVLGMAFSWTGAADRLLRGNDISYGLYIYHMVVVNVLLTLGLRGECSHFAIAAIATVVAAAASWFIVEKRALAMKGKLAQLASTVLFEWRVKKSLV